ncbi:MAG: hypothetical protein AMXMBFR23_04150 [Chloroflexota bacterium]
MLLVGQSLLLWRGRLARALAAAEAAPLLDRAARQVEAGAAALDLNAGTEGTTATLVATVRALRPAHPGLPLWLDAAAAGVLATTLDACAAAGLRGPFVANAAGAGGTPDAGSTRLLEACARHRAGVVVSPRAVDAGSRPATAEAVAAAALEGLETARAIGLTGPVYLDALAWPAASDPPRAERSLAVLRRLRDVPGAVPLVAVGNVAHGLGWPLTVAMRGLYAAAATAAGAGALIMPVEETATVRAVQLACGEAFPADVAESYLATFGEAIRAGEHPHPPPRIAGETLREAWRLLFDAD